MSSIYTPLLQKVKAHHESINAAYSTYYGAGTNSTSSTPVSSAKPSVRPSMESDRTRSTSSTSSTTSTMSKAWSTIKKAAREHHESVNGAYQVYYGQGMRTPSSSAATSRNTSTASAPISRMDEKEKKVHKAWAKAKKMAREHHKSVNSAYDAYWAAGLR